LLLDVTIPRMRMEKSTVKKIMTMIESPVLRGPYTRSGVVHEEIRSK
jgi:hypothetical protein